jgi:hypothetical protein
MNIRNGCEAFKTHVIHLGIAWQPSKGCEIAHFPFQSSQIVTSRTSELVKGCAALRLDACALRTLIARLLRHTRVALSSPPEVRESSRRDFGSCRTEGVSKEQPLRGLPEARLVSAKNPAVVSADPFHFPQESNQ